MSVGQLELLRGVGAGRRFVEQDHLRFGGERAGDLETASRTVGELGGDRFASFARPTNSSNSSTTASEVCSPRRVRGPFTSAPDEPDTAVVFGPDLDVLKDAERTEESRGLEGPRDAGLGDRCAFLPMTDRAARRRARRR